MKFNLAISLTLVRIVAIPLFIVSFYFPVPYARPLAAIVFGLAAITDMLDGYVARRMNQTTAFGTFLDPVADKLIVATALVLLVQSDPRLSVALVAAIIIGREITVSALREWMATLGDRTTVAVSLVAKSKTTMQMIGLGLMVWRDETFGVDIYSIGLLLVFIAAGLTMYTMVAYLRAAWPALSRGS